MTSQTRMSAESSLGRCTIRRAFCLVVQVLCVVMLLGAVSCQKLAKSIREQLGTDEKVEKVEPIEDLDYRFKLSQPAAGWKLLAEKDAQKLAPASIAAASNATSTVFGVVIVEALPGFELETYVNLIVDQMALEEKAIEKREDIQFAGAAATRVVLSGKVRDISLRYSATLFLHQGHGYQLLAWGSRDTVNEADLEAFFSAFSLLPGEVMGRNVSTATADGSGVGWSVSGGVFKSAVTGLSVSPPAGFRVLVGGELEAMNPEAAVGWLRQAPDVYSIVLTERVSSNSVEGMRSLVASQFRAGLGNPEARTQFEQPALGASRQFDVYDTEAGFTYIYGAFALGEHLLQIVSWYPKGIGEKGLEEFKSGLRGLGKLEEAERAKLEAELAAQPDPQNSVGPTHALRRGVYLDFDYNLRWERPDSGIWQVFTGAAARAQEAGSTLFVTEERTNTYGALTLTRGKKDATSHHREFLAAYPNLEVKQERTLESASNTGRKLRFTVTQAEAKGEGVEYEYEYSLATALDGDIGVAFMFWGIKGLLDFALIDKAIGGLHALPELKMVNDAAGEYTDLRMGFSIKLPNEWTRRDLTPKDAVPIGTVMSFKRDSKTITVVALAALSAGQDESWFNEHIEGLMREPLKAISSEPSVSETRFLDQPAKQTTYKSLLQRVDVLVFTRDRTSYALIAQDMGGETLKIASNAFRFIRG